MLLFSVLMGALWLATVPLTSGLVAQIWGLRYMGTLYGIVFFSHQLGGFLGVWLGGRLYDLYGNYTLVWWVGVGVGAFSALVHLPIRERPAPSRAWPDRPLARSSRRPGAGDQPGDDGRCGQRRHIAVIRASLPVIRRHLDRASDAFYVNLFTLAPSSGSCSRPTWRARACASCRRSSPWRTCSTTPGAFAAGIDRLAAVHFRVGVRAAHFAPMGYALLVTLGEVMGTAFTREVQQAWRAAYDRIAAEMIRRGGLAVPEGRAPRAAAPPRQAPGGPGAAPQ